MIRKNGSRGFTLLELMVVVVIIATLVGIAIPVYISSLESARTNTCKSNQRTIYSSAVQFWHQNGRFPTDINEIVTSSYLKSTPICPDGGTYNYDPATGMADCSIAAH